MVGGTSGIGEGENYESGEVIGLDVDPQVIPIAEANAELNKLSDRIQYIVGDAAWLIASGIEPFDLIVSNILAESHLQSIEMGLLDSLRSGGHLVLSGMYRSGTEKVIDVLHEMDCELVAKSRMGRL